MSWVSDRSALELPNSIPNLEVKRSSGDDSRWATGRENTSLLIQFTIAFFDSLQFLLQLEKLSENKKITPYPDVNKILLSFKEGLLDIFNDNLIALYLTGSLTYDDFNPERSDIDLVAILKKPASPKELKLIKKLHQEIERDNKKWIKRTECSYVPLEMLSSILPPKTPRPYFGEGTFYAEAPYGNEWIINNYVLYKYGIALIGEDFDTLVDPVDIKEVKKASIRDLFEEWQPKTKNLDYFKNSHNQSYVVLKMCRILHTVFRNSVASKKVSSVWAKKEFSEWKDLIETAERWKYGDEMNRATDVVEFVNFVVGKIEE